MQSKGCEARSANHHPKGLIMLTDDQRFFFSFLLCSMGGYHPAILAQVAMISQMI
jgi:hypothetical protein